MNFKTEKIVVIILASMLASGVLSISIPEVHAATAAVKWMPQAMGFGPYAVVSKEFKVTMEIHDVLDLYGFDIKCGWNTGYLQYINHTLHIPVETYPDGVLHEAPGHPVWTIMDWVDEWGIPGTPAGTMYWLAVAAEEPSPSFNGSGVVFDMFFRILNQPTKNNPPAVFDFLITETALSNSTGWAITHDTFDATVTIFNENADWHDVAVTDVTTNATIVDPGEAVNITVVVENLGDYTETFDVTVYNMTGAPPRLYSSIIGTQTVTSLASKASKTLYFLWDTTTDIYGGDYTIKAEASTVTDETAFPFDNIFIDGSVYVRPHDVAVIDVTTDVPFAGPGDIVTVSVVVENVGYHTETFDVTAYNGTAIIGTQTVIGLASLGTDTLYFPWDTTGTYYNYTIKAEAHPVPWEPCGYPWEQSLDDNTLVDGWVYVRIPGDITDDTPGLPPPDAPDGDVDGYDLGAFADAYGSSLGAPEYTIFADLTDDTPGIPPDAPDGDVDAFDLGVFADNYGTSV